MTRAAEREAYPLTDVPWADRRADVMERAFGAAATVESIPFPHALAAKVPPIHVWVWPDKLGPGLSLIMTEGLSDVLLHDGAGGDAQYCIELLSVTSDPKWAANVLRVTGEAIVSSYGGLFMGIGETLSLSNPPSPIVVGSEFTRLVLLAPPSALLGPCEALMKFKIRKRKLMVLWCLGISEAELQLLHSIGDEELGTKFEAERLDFNRATRPLL